MRSWLLALCLGLIGSACGDDSGKGPTPGTRDAAPQRELGDASCRAASCADAGSGALDGGAAPTADASRSEDPPDAALDAGREPQDWGDDDASVIARKWGAIVELCEPVMTSYPAPTLSVARAGNAAVAWNRGTDGLVVRRFEAGKWTDALELETVAQPRFLNYHDIFVGSSGEATLLFTLEDSSDEAHTGRNAIFTRRFRAGVWEPRVLLEQGGDNNDATSLSLIGDDRALFAMWDRQVNYTISFERRRFYSTLGAEGFTQPRPVASPALDIDTAWFQFALDPGSDLVGIYSQRFVGPVSVDRLWDVYGVRYRDGAFMEPVKLAGAFKEVPHQGYGYIGYGIAPRVSRNDAHVWWWTTAQVETVNFASNGTLTTSSDRPAIDPSTLTALTTTHKSDVEAVLWTQREPMATAGTLRFSRKVQGGAWSQPFTVGERIGGTDEQGQLLTLAGGDLMAIWLEPMPTDQLLWSRHYVASEDRWEAPVRIAEPGGPALVEAAVDGQGALTVVWMQGTQVLARRWE